MSDYDPAFHEIHVSIENEGNLDLRIFCAAPHGAQCRLTCDEGCEEFTYEDHEHPLVDGGECMPLVYIENQDSVLDFYAGPRHDLRPGKVVLTYHPGDYYVTWAYPSVGEIPLFEVPAEAAVTP